MSYLTDLIAKHGVENVFFYGPASVVNWIGPIAYTSSNDQQVMSLFRITEDRYKAVDGYKIGLEPVTEGLASEHFYTMDLESILDTGRFKAFVRIQAFINEDLILSEGIENVFFYTKVHVAKTFMGIKLSPKGRDGETLALLSIQKLKNRRVYFGSESKAFWESNISIEALNAMNKINNPDMLLVRLKSREESLSVKKAG